MLFDRGLSESILATTLIPLHVRLDPIPCKQAEKNSIPLMILDSFSFGFTHSTAFLWACVELNKFITTIGNILSCSAFASSRQLWRWKVSFKEFTSSTSFIQRSNKTAPQTSWKWVLKIFPINYNSLGIRLLCNGCALCKLLTFKSTLSSYKTPHKEPCSLSFSKLWKM